MEEPADIDPKLLEILVCPLTKAPLRYDRDAQELIRGEAGLAYPIRDGIPIMLVDEARPLRDDETPQKRLPQPGATPAPGRSSWASNRRRSGSTSNSTTGKSSVCRRNIGG